MMLTIRYCSKQKIDLPVEILIIRGLSNWYDTLQTTNSIEKLCSFSPGLMSHLISLGYSCND